MGGERGGGEREKRESENRKGRIRGSGQSMGFVKLHSDLPQSLFDPMVLKIVECVSHRVPTQYNNGTIFGDTVVHVVGEKAIYPLGQIGTRPLPVGNSVAAKYYIYFNNQKKKIGCLLCPGIRKRALWGFKTSKADARNKKSTQRDNERMYNFSQGERKKSPSGF